VASARARPLRGFEPSCRLRVSAGSTERCHETKFNSPQCAVFLDDVCVCHARALARTMHTRNCWPLGPRGERAKECLEASTWVITLVMVLLVAPTADSDASVLRSRPTTKPMPSFRERGNDINKESKNEKDPKLAEIGRRSMEQIYTPTSVVFKLIRKHNQLYGL
jgi:hypothetical protein